MLLEKQQVVSQSYALHTGVVLLLMGNQEGKAIFFNVMITSGPETSFYLIAKKKYQFSNQAFWRKKSSTAN